MSAEIKLPNNDVLIINHRNLISISASLFDRVNIDQPSFGIISNTGEITFVDRQAQIKELARKRQPLDNLITTIKVKNTITKKEEVIATMLTSNWRYSNYSNEVTVDLTDGLTEWQDILVDKFTLRYDLSLYGLYGYLKSITPKKWKFKEIDSNLYNYMLYNACQYGYMTSGNLWQQWSKFCELAGFNLYLDKNNEIAINCDIVRSNTYVSSDYTE